jgi:hypothetical protein
MVAVGRIPGSMSTTTYFPTQDDEWLTEAIARGGGSAGGQTFGVLW